MADIEQNHPSKVTVSSIKESPEQVSQVDSFPGKVQVSEEERELAQSLLNYVPASDAEKKLVRKVDLIMMPTLWCMYILAVLDRSNIVMILSFPGRNTLI